MLRGQAVPPFLDPAQGYAIAQFLSIGSTDDIHQFRDLAALVGLVAAVDRMLDAMRDVISQDFLLDTPQRGSHR
jgi:hypothetical protein